MNITKNQIDNLNATIKIELGKEDYAERVEKALKDYQKKVVVKGFRPGKTPMGMVKRMYGQSLLFEEINKILGEALGNYIKENNLNILGEPLPNETEQKPLNLEDEHFEFLYDIALAPEVNVKMSKREKLPYYKIKVDDEMIDKQIEAICKNIFVISSMLADRRNSLLLSRMIARGAITNDQLPKQKRRSRSEYENEEMNG